MTFSVISKKEWSCNRRALFFPMINILSFLCVSELWSPINPELDSSEVSNSYQSVYYLFFSHSHLELKIFLQITKNSLKVHTILCSVFLLTNSRLMTLLSTCLHVRLIILVLLSDVLMTHYHSEINGIKESISLLDHHNWAVNVTDEQIRLIDHCESIITSDKSNLND